MKKIISLIIMAFIAVSSYAKPDFDIPEIEKYDNAEQCKKDNDIVYKSAKYYLSTDMQDDKYEAISAAKYMWVWTQASEEIVFTIGPKTSPYLKCKDEDRAVQMLGAYLSGCIIYCLDNKQREHDFNMHYYAISQMLTYYDKNKSTIGNERAINKMLKNLKSGKLREKEEKKFNKK